MQTDLETATLIEDLIELPGFRAIREALMGAGAGAFRTMGLVCRDQAERIPDRIALRFEDEEVSYGAYNEGVNRFAHLLRRHGVGPGRGWLRGRPPPTRGSRRGAVPRRSPWRFAGRDAPRRTC